MVYKNLKGQSLIVNCNCGCGKGIEFRVNKDEDDYASLSLISSDWYANQLSGWDIFKEKIKKIWFILRGKDYYYSEIILNKDEWEEFKKIINEVG